MEKIEEKCSKVRKTVVSRIEIAREYLEFVKQLNQFRNLTTDLQEIFKSLSSNTSSTTELVFEKHVSEKMKIFEKLFTDLSTRGQSSIALLKNVRLILKTICIFLNI